MTSVNPAPAATDHVIDRLAAAVGLALDHAGSPAGAAEQIQRALKVALESPDLVPDDLPGPPLSTYRQHLLHVDPAGRFSIAALVWLPGHRTPVHDHRCWCCFGVWKGREVETHWERDADGRLVPGPKSVCYPGDVEFLLPPGDIHQVSNDDTVPTISIHVYGVDLSVAGTSIHRRYDVEGSLPSTAGGTGEQVVAVVGGGFSGTMTAVHLLRRGGPGTRVALFEAAPEAGKGAAYGTNSPSHLLNVPVAGMSAFPDRPDHFLDWCHAKGKPAAAGDFVPRQWYGEYLGDVLKEAAITSGGRLEVRSERVDHVDRRGDGFEVACEGGSLSCAAVVLAIGTPPDRQRLAAGPVWPEMTDPWRRGALDEIRPGETVLIVGTGLTSMDVLAELESRGHHAKIVAISRHGLHPVCHACGGAPGAFDAAAFRESLEQEPRKVSALCRSLRAAVKDAVAAGCDWREVVNALRPMTAALWSALPPAERRRFTRHLKPFWEVVRHRVAPATLEASRRLLDAGLLEYSRGHLTRLRKLDDGTFEADWWHRANGITRRRFHRVVNATGFSSRLSDSASPLLQDLLEKGWIREDEMGLGVETASDFRLVDRNGTVVAGIHYVGPMLRARFWECTAVPELRCRASEAADAVLAGIAAAPIPG